MFRHTPPPATSATAVLDALNRAGVGSILYLYDTKDGGWQVEIYGKARPIVARLEKAGFTRVHGSQDWIGDAPYALVRFYGFPGQALQ